MKSESLRKFVVRSLAAILLSSLLTAAGAAQEPAPPPGVEPSEKPVVTTPQEGKKTRGRLPAYFGKVVNDKQRAQIYGIQAKYNEQIAKLKEQLEDLTVQRDSEIEQVLTDEQRAEIAKLKSQRQSRRSGASEEDAPSDGQ